VTFAPAASVQLAPFTTLGLGGPAEHFVEVQDRATLLEALRWAEREQLRVGVFSGGSNLVVPDAGFPGLVLRMATRGVELVRSGDEAELTAQAGETWDDVVALSLAEDLAGFECLTGIPGSTGATPIQNVGAYGQEVSDTLVAVEVLERASLHTSWIDARDCAFSYRDSRFKHEPERFIVLAVRFRLRAGGAPSVRYPELLRALSLKHAKPGLRDVAETVRGLRAQKSMLLDAHDENRRSAGSFFMNPIVSAQEAERVVQRALLAQIIQKREEMPSFAADEGRVKLAAGWLIERAGMHKGLRRGAVGISSKHALSLVHHGGGTTSELLALAAEVRAAVQQTFGVSWRDARDRAGALVAPSLRSACRRTSTRRSCTRSSPAAAAPRESTRRRRRRRSAP
jgi:UDP-N-acetylmuramate dehydrogenase